MTTQTDARPVGSKNQTDRRGITQPLDDNSAEAHPIARGTSLAPRAADRFLEETAGHCPSLDDSARHGNGRHSCSAPAATTARGRGSPWTGIPEIAILPESDLTALGLDESNNRYMMESRAGSL